MFRWQCYYWCAWLLGVCLWVSGPAYAQDDGLDPADLATQRETRELISMALQAVDEAAIDEDHIALSYAARAQAYAIGARLMAELGEGDEAQRLLREAQTKARQIQDHPEARGDTLWSITEALVAMGEIDAAMTMANTIEDADYSARAWIEIAVTQARAEEDDAFASSVLRIRELAELLDDREHDWTTSPDEIHSRLAVRLLEHGLYPQAVAIHRLIRDRSEQAHVLAAMACHHAAAGRLTEARQATQQAVNANLVRDPMIFTWTSPLLARAYALMGERREAMQAAQRSGAAIAYLHIARVDAERADSAGFDAMLQRAEETAAATRRELERLPTYQPSPFDWLWDQYDLGAGHARMRTVAQVRERFETVEDVVERGYALLGAADTYAHLLRVAAARAEAQTQAATGDTATDPDTTTP